MEPYRPAVRLATIAALTLLPASASQRPPDPTLEIPQARGWIPDDPYESSTELGALHRPKGRIRKVTWYRQLPEEDAWSKRIVQTFDDEGRCVEVERWCCGAREYWRTARSPTGAPRDFEQTWGHPLFQQAWREDTVCDRSGARIGLMRIPLTLVAREPQDTQPRTVATWNYDEEGRCVREVRYDELRWPVSIRRWHYDELGRVQRVVDHTGSSQQTETFEYDGEGRLSARASPGQGGRAIRRSEFEYDAQGRLSRIADRIDQAVTRAVTFGYGEDGRLLRRETQSFLIESQRKVETFEGVDRPLLRELYGSEDRVVESARWTYVDDSRGNWIRKTCLGTSDVRREIEYAD